ncbi:MAG: hypothetical protein RIS84_1757 [Pseudomonadota bacterium]|jgi:hypothetical protein
MGDTPQGLGIYISDLFAKIDNNASSINVSLRTLLEDSEHGKRPTKGLNHGIIR